MKEMIQVSLWIICVWFIISREWISIVYFWVFADKYMGTRLNHLRREGKLLTVENESIFVFIKCLLYCMSSILQRVYFLICVMDWLKIFVNFIQLNINHLLMCLDVIVVLQYIVFNSHNFSVQKVQCILECFNSYDHISFDSLMMFILFVHEEHLSSIKSIDVIFSIVVWNMNLVLMQRSSVLIKLIWVLVFVESSVGVYFVYNVGIITLLWL